MRFCQWSAFISLIGEVNYTKNKGKRDKIAEEFYKDKMQKENIEVYFQAWRFALNKFKLG